MALLSSPLLLRLHALTLLTLSYYLLVSPTTLLSSPALTLLGESMRLPPPAFSVRPHHAQTHLPPAVRDALGLAGLGLGLLGFVTFWQAAGLGVPESLRFVGQGDKRRAEDEAKGRVWKGQVPSMVPREVKVSRERRGEDLAVLSGAQSGAMGLAVVRVVLEGCLVGWVYLRFGWGVERGRAGVLGMAEGLSGRKDGVGEVLGNQVVFSLGLADMLFWGYLWTVVKEERRVVWEGVQRWKAEEEGGGGKGD